MFVVPLADEDKKHYLSSDIVAAVGLVVVSGFTTSALEYKDHDYDDQKDLKQFNYCVKDHHGGDISGYYLNKCGEKYLERV